MKPLIYFSYGMTKSGSTLAYELARSALVLAGLVQPRLSTDAVEDRKKVNFVAHIDARRMAALRAEIGLIGHVVALKTHTRPDPDVVTLLQSGQAIAHAIYRDPREIALSMLDHGRRARSAGKQAFSEFVTLDDTIGAIRHQTNSLRAWLSLPNVRPLYYEDVAFDMTQSTLRIMECLGVRADPEAVIAMATGERFTQLNKGVRRRYEAEMTPADQARFRAEFAPMFDRLIDRRAALPRDGRPVLHADDPLSAVDAETTSRPAGRG